MQDLCHATRYVRTSSKPMGGILIKFLHIQILGLYFSMCVVFFYYFLCVPVFVLIFLCVFLYCISWLCCILLLFFVNIFFFKFLF